MMGSTKEEQAWAIAHGAKEEEVKREGEVPRKTGVKEGFWMGRTEVTVGQWKQFVAETGYYTDAKNLGYTSYAPRKGQVFGRVDGASWENPSFGALPQDNHPVCCVTWNDAVAFCEWLIEREQKAGRLPAGLKVRLPTEAEWEYACRAGTQTKFWWGELLEDWKDRLNWVGTVDGFEFASPVDHYGVRGRNKFGLADMLGNVTEWCTGEYDTKRADRKSHGSNTVFRVYRGGSFIDGPGQVRCASRSDSVISSRTCSFHGFRVCYGGDVSSVTTPTASTSPVDAPKDAGILAPPETRVAALTTNPKVGDVYTLALSSNVTMELMGIPPGEFMMGSTKEERAWAKANDCKDEFMEREDEQPRKTRIRQAFWMGRTEVTVGQWKQFVAEAGYRTDAEKKGYVDFAPQKEQLWGRVVGASWKDPNFGSPPRDDHPVCCVSWNDAMAYCEWLSERERKLGRFPAGFEVRLPTEAEWEYACRAGTQSKFWWGESPEDGKDRLNWRGTPNSFQFASPVDIFGERGRNKFGLADMLGNVWEWCLDEYDPKQAHEECYKGNRLVRVSRGGGGFVIETGQVRSAFRNCDNPSFSRCTRGFRVVVGVNVSGAMTITASTSPAAVANESGILAPPETRVTALTTTPKVGEGDAFAREVTALPTEEQVKRVIAKLKELNPQFDGKEQHKIESGAVTELSFSTVAVKDISPLRALKGLKKLTLLPWVAGGARPPGALSDLSPLQGMPLTFLACGNTQVNNLAPLKGMPLTILSMDGTQVADLSPLEGMPLTILWCDKAKVTDLSPLARVKGPLKELRCDFVPERDAAVLRGIKTLEKINNMPAAAFWAKAGPASVAAVSDRRNLPATDGAQRAPLQTATAGKVNPAYAARLTPQTRAAAVQRLGGTPASETAVTRALEWMKKSQNSDGSWGGLYKVSMTGFALLAFLAHGETETSQPYGEAVGKAIKWLLDTGQRNGGKLSLQHPEYQHPIAVSPLCEAYALTQNAALLPPLEKAVALIVNSQCSNGSWDYGYNTKGRNDDKRPGGDTSISSWNIQALKAAQRAGVKTPGMEACMSKALDFLREVYDAKTGRFGYATRSGGSPALVAAGAYCMHLLGVGDSKETRGALGSLRSVKGDWTKANESSTYGWYYATFATFHAGGSHWVSWNREFRDELVKHQNADGSWSVPGSNGKEPPVAARGFAQIRDPQDAAVYHTAVLTLMLESYYRFTPSTR
jgi:formylglycine-generating enzyme required for sulfatase activity